MNRFDIINRIGDKYRIGNTETGEFSYAQALKTVGKDIKDYQKATTGAQHKFLDIRFENDRLAVLVECKNKFSRAELRDAAHAAGAAALFSEHHFDATPATDAMADTLTGMADAGADIAKLAVMPRCAADAARLLEATARAADARPDTPLITMSMGPLGAVTRFCGGGFGSCATFGVTSGTSASAPGQPPADLLKAKLITAPL